MNDDESQYMEREFTGHTKGKDEHRGYRFVGIGRDEISGYPYEIWEKV